MKGGKTLQQVKNVPRGTKVLRYYHTITKECLKNTKPQTLHT